MLLRGLNETKTILYVKSLAPCLTHSCLSAEASQIKLNEIPTRPLQALYIPVVWDGWRFSPPATLEDDRWKLLKLLST